MSADEFTEITKTSWGSRIGSSIKGILFGLALIVVAVAGLFWNEGRAVTTAKSLDEGAGAVVSVEASRVDAANEGRLIHITGLATTDETLEDQTFGVTAKALILGRRVQMYQWKETTETTTKKNTGGSETTKTTYRYGKVWSESLINSGSFKKQEGHQNPGSMPYQTRTVSTQKAKVGAFRLTSAQVMSISAYQELPLGPDYKLPADLDKGSRIGESELYLGANPNSPRVGDMKVSFAKVEPTTVSIVARQQGDGFDAYQTKAGDKLLMIKTGQIEAAAMFKAAQSSNKVLTWILRLVGFVLMFIGFSLIFKPLSVVMDVLPVLGNIAGAGLGIVSGLLSVVISIVVIAIAWLVYRPLLGVILIAVAGGLFVLLIKLRGKKKGQPAQAKGAAAPPPPPPPPSA